QVRFSANTAENRTRYGRAELVGTPVTGEVVGQGAGTTFVQYLRKKRPSFGRSPSPWDTCDRRGRWGCGRGAPGRSAGRRPQGPRDRVVRTREGQVDQRGGQQAVGEPRDRVGAADRATGQGVETGLGSERDRG